MAQGGGGTKIVFESFGALEASVSESAEKAVADLAFGVQERAMVNLRNNNNIDTGALRRSIYVEARRGVPQDMQRGPSLAAAQGLASQPGAKSGAAHEANPAIAPRPIRDSHLARVGVCVEYGIYIEMGTRNARAFPFLHPAALEIKGIAPKVVARYIQEAARLVTR